MENELQNYTEKLFQELAQLGKSLGSDKRLEILNLLVQSPKSVDTIAKEIHASVANTSRHLQNLKSSHLVKAEKEGNRVIYQLSSPKIRQLINLLLRIGEDEITEMQSLEYRSDNAVGVKTLSLAQAREQQADSVLLDVRPNDEYVRGHVKGAINIPYEELANHLERLPKDQKIIVYCRGRLCSISNQAAQMLNMHGFEAFSLNNTYQEWQLDHHN